MTSNRETSFDTCLATRHVITDIGAEHPKPRDWSLVLTNPNHPRGRLSKAGNVCSHFNISRSFELNHRPCKESIINTPKLQLTRSRGTQESRDSVRVKDDAQDSRPADLLLERETGRLKRLYLANSNLSQITSIASKTGER